MSAGSFLVAVSNGNPEYLREILFRTVIKQCVKDSLIRRGDRCILAMVGMEAASSWLIVGGRLRPQKMSIQLIVDLHHDPRRFIRSAKDSAFRCNSERRIHDVLALVKGEASLVLKVKDGSIVRNIVAHVFHPSFVIDFF